jgi:hypothetical protein
MTTDQPSPPINHGKPKAKGPWLSRLAINVLTATLAVLIYWLLGFIVQDIGSVAGPDYSEVEKRHLDQELVEREKTLEQEIKQTARLVDKQNQKQKLLSQSSQGLQKTMSQLLDLQRLSLEKNLTLSAEQSESFNESLKVFLSNQDRFQEINEEIAALVEKQQGLEDEQSGVRARLEEQRKPAQEEYRRLSEQHRSRLALIKLLVLVPLFIAGAWLVLKKRGHTYFPLFLAFAGATSAKMIMVMHEHFPQRYFKYILILISLIAAARLLVYFIRSIIAPKKDKLIHQYRDAYEKFLCPVCEYPIRRGPMKFLYWNRRSLKKLRLPASSPGGESPADDPYTCPSCSTQLFSECASCHATRPTLLPFCDHCGTPGEIDAEP